MPIPHLNAAPICLASFVREHMFGTAQELGEYVGRHYVYSILRQALAFTSPLGRVFLTGWGGALSRAMVVPCPGPWRGHSLAH